MKKIIPIFLACMASLAVLSCDVVPQPQTDPNGSQYQAGPTLEILSKDVVFQPQGGSGVIVVNTSAALSASSDRSWAEVSVSGNRVTLTVSRNESIESRYAMITIKAGDASTEITAQQFGLNSEYAWEESYSFPYAGGDLSLPYGEPGTVRVNVSETNWISAVVDEANNMITFTAEKSIYNYERKGYVSVTIGDAFDREVRFVQEPNPSGLNPGDAEPITFTVQEAWTPKYVDPESPDDPKSTVGVDVAEDSHAGRYFIKVVPQNDFTADGGDEQLFLNRYAPVWAKEGPQIFRASSTTDIEKLTLGSYRVYAIGVNNQNEVNGTYAVARFEVTKVLSPYEKFLGTWSFDRNGTEDVWTVTEKVAGKTYTVTGIDGITDVAVEAEFNAADGTVTIRAQKDLGQHTVNTSSGNLTGQAAIYGRILYQGTEYYVTGTYPIFTIKFDTKATTGTLDPGSVNTNIGEFDLVGFSIYTIIDDSAYSTTNKASLPAIIKHLTYGEGSGEGGGGEGGGGGDDPGTDAYSKWIGSWSVGDVTLTVSQKVKDQTYTVSGLEGFDFETRFKDGKMEFFYQDLAESDGMVLSLYGIDDDGDGYIVEGDPENDGWLATATLNASGNSANLVGAEFDAVYGGTTYHERIVVLLLLAYDGEQFYYASNDPKRINMPTTMTKTTTSSVKALRSACYDSRKGEFIPLYRTLHTGPAVPFKNK